MEKQIDYPIYFYDNTCVHCGAKAVVPIDKYDRPSKSMIYPIKNLQCMKCNRRYFINWIKDEDDNMIPVTSSKNEISLFEDDVVKYAAEHRRKLN